MWMSARAARRGGLAVAVELVVGVVVVAAAAAAAVLASATPAADYHARADDAVQSLLVHYWNPDQNYLRMWSGDSDDPSCTDYWKFALALDAVCDAVERTGGAHYAGWLYTLFSAQDARGWSRGYYDDEMWMVKALLRAHALTGGAEPAMLVVAQKLLQDVMAQWDTTCCGAHPGGVWWDDKHTQKATASNAGPALAATQMYQRTGDVVYLQFAERVFAFWHDNMMNSSTGAVADHISASDGSVVWWRFTYNEGLMLDAALTLHNVTGQTAYLLVADQLAQYILSAETAASALGPVLSDGSTASCSNDCTEFKHPAYRALLHYAARPHSAHAAAVAALLQRCADAIWLLARNTDGLYATDWAGPPVPLGQPVLQGAANAAAAALSLYAARAGPYPGPVPPPQQAEAEDGALWTAGVSRNASGAPGGSFSGWGYVPLSCAETARVQVQVAAPSGSARVRVRVRTAAERDTARVVVLNGQPCGRLPIAASGDAAWGLSELDCDAPGDGRVPATLQVAVQTQGSGVLQCATVLLDWIQVVSA